MEYIVKKHPIPEGELKGYNIPESPERYDFYTTETIKDVLGNDVQIPKLIGSYSSDELQKQKTSLEESLVDVNVKIELINNLK